MKRLMIAMLSLMLTVPMMAQYGPRTRYRGSYVRPRTHYTPARPSGYSPLDMYFGLRGGGAFSTVSSDDPLLDGGSMRAGVNVGFVAGFQMVPSTPLYFETGLMYVEKGGEGKYQGSKFTYSLNYLEVPLLLKYNGVVDRDLSIQPFIGGFLSAGVGGKIRDFGHRQAFSSFSDDGFKRFDGGIRLGCGLQYAHLYAEVGYDIGLANISRDSFDTSRTGSLFATLGVNF